MECNIALELTASSIRVVPPPPHPQHSTLLPLHSTQMGFITTADSHDQATQPFSWKRWKWRLLQPHGARQMAC